MKTLSRDEMKKVMGGNHIKTLWRCQVEDYVTPGGATHYLCNINDPSTVCLGGVWGCVPISTCAEGIPCIAY